MLHNLLLQALHDNDEAFLLEHTQYMRLKRCKVDIDRLGFVSIFHGHIFRRQEIRFLTAGYAYTGELYNTPTKYADLYFYKPSTVFIRTDNHILTLRKKYTDSLTHDPIAAGLGEPSGQGAYLGLEQMERIGLPAHIGES